MPFSTDFYSEYAGAELYTKELKVPMTFYVLDFAAAFFLIYLLWRLIGNPKNKLAEPAIDKGVLKMASQPTESIFFRLHVSMPYSYYKNFLRLYVINNSIL